MKTGFDIGDEVIITKGASEGKKFVVTYTDEFVGEPHYSGPGVCWYPASSLRLVEELKICDWVQIIGKPCAISARDMGKIYQITETNPSDGDMKVNGWWYVAASLRKLTPEEALCHITKRLDSSEYINASLEALEGRISTIEKRLDHIADVFGEAII